MIDMHFDPYNRNYVITMEVSPELAAKLEDDPEAMKAFSDFVQSNILAAFSHTRPTLREETR